MAKVEVYSSKFSFKGGIHPRIEEQKYDIAKIKQIPLPASVVLPLKQHIGKACEPCVSIGEQVFKGQVVAHGIAPVHATTSGVVSNIGLYPATTQFAMAEMAIEITVDGKDEWMAGICPMKDYRSQSAQTLLKAIERAGIVGLGGAGFPTITKVKSSGIDTIIVNAAECEPHINADNALMQNHAEQIMHGVSIIAHILGATKCMVGIEDDKAAAIEAMQLAAHGVQIDTDIVVCPTIYPSGSERLLIKLLTGKEVPTKSLPSSLGMVSINVGTLYAIYSAVCEGKPLLERISTVCGDAVKHPGNYLLRLGTPIEHVLNVVHGGASVERLVIGGPMMGFNLPDSGAPVTKIVNCLMVSAQKQKKQQTLPCIKCGECADVCPVSLLPQQLLWYAKAEEFSKLDQYNLFDCIECGACSYVCPSNIPLVQYYRHSKKTMQNAAVQKKQAEHAKKRFEFRNKRLEVAKQERAAKQKKRLANVSTAPVQSSSSADKQAELAKIKIALDKIDVQLKKFDGKDIGGEQQILYSQLQQQKIGLQKQKKQIEC